MDFTNCKIDPLKVYSGANGSKLGIILNGEHYMLKFPTIAKHNNLMSYANSSVSEYLACHIFNLVGPKSQDTILGTYNDKLVVACKDFETDGFQFKDFGSIKNTIIDSEHNGYGTELNDILATIKEQTIYDSQKLLSFFWQQFVVDAIIGNFDRHNGNWGFLINSHKGQVKLAPVFDCGSALFPQNRETDISYILNSPKEIERRIYERPTSAIRLNDTRINYYVFFKNYTDNNFSKAVQEIHNNFDLEKINSLIEQTPYISNIHKDFYKVIIKERYTNILDRSLSRHKKIIQSVEKPKNSVLAKLKDYKSQIENDTKLNGNYRSSDLHR